MKKWEFWGGWFSQVNVAPTAGTQNLPKKLFSWSYCALKITIEICQIGEKIVGEFSKDYVSE